MLSTILSVFHKRWPGCLQAALVISYYKHVDIKGTTPGVGQGKELSLLAGDGVHLNPVTRRLMQMAHNPLHLCSDYSTISPYSFCILFIECIYTPFYLIDWIECLIHGAEISFSGFTYSYVSSSGKGSILLIFCDCQIFTFQLVLKLYMQFWMESWEVMNFI